MVIRVIYSITIVHLRLYLPRLQFLEDLIVTVKLIPNVTTQFVIANFRFLLMKEELEGTYAENRFSTMKNIITEQIT